MLSFRFDLERAVAGDREHPRGNLGNQSWPFLPTASIPSSVPRPRQIGLHSESLYSLSVHLALTRSDIGVWLAIRSSCHPCCHLSTRTFAAADVARWPRCLFGDARCVSSIVDLKEKRLRFLPRTIFALRWSLVRCHARLGVSILFSSLQLRQTTLWSRLGITRMAHGSSSHFDHKRGFRSGSDDGPAVSLILTCTTLTSSPVLVSRRGTTLSEAKKSRTIMPVKQRRICLLFRPATGTSLSLSRWPQKKQGDENTWTAMCNRRVGQRQPRPLALGFLSLWHETWLDACFIRCKSFLLLPCGRNERIPVLAA